MHFSLIALASFIAVATPSPIANDAPTPIMNNVTPVRRQSPLTANANPGCSVDCNISAQGGDTTACCDCYCSEYVGTDGVCSITLQFQSRADGIQQCTEGSPCTLGQSCFTVSKINSCFPNSPILSLRAMHREANIEAEL